MKRLSIAVGDEEFNAKRNNCKDDNNLRLEDATLMVQIIHALLYFTTSKAQASVQALLYYAQCNRLIHLDDDDQLTDNDTHVEHSTSSITTTAPRTADKQTIVELSLGQAKKASVNGSIGAFARM